MVGGLSKILKRTGYTSVVSFANRSRTNRNNNIYLKSGFVETRTTAPNYVYIYGKYVKSRYQAMKHKLPELLGDMFDSMKSEKQNMLDNKWLQVYDSGQIFYSWNNA